MFRRSRMKPSVVHFERLASIRGQGFYLFESAIVCLKHLVCLFCAIKACVHFVDCRQTTIISNDVSMLNLLLSNLVSTSFLMSCTTLL